ncbi:MAG: hypothetical protein JSR82_09150 [Verrucomicrobia bacterium]|nr:hypothetical protein [Verrucomicrobiota bacterium]
MWTDVKKGVRWVLGTGPRRISMDPVFEAERLRREKWARILILLGLIFVVGAVYATPHLWRQLQNWRADRIGAEALRAWESGDGTEAGRLAVEAAQIAPRHPTVLLARARLAETDEPAEAVVAWERVLEQRPEESTYRIELAFALHRAGRIGEAQRALERAGEALRTARGQWIAGLVAAARGDTDRAQACLRQALALGLKDPVEARLALAALLIETPAHAEARGLLEPLEKHPRFGRRARGLLAEEARAAGDPARAVQLARTLVLPPGVEPEDQVRLTRLLVATQSWVALEEHIDALVPFARTNRKLAAVQLACLLELGRFVQAEGWLNDLPPEIRNSAEVTPLAARTAAREQRQEALLRETLRRGDWTGAEVAQVANSARLAEFEQRDRLRQERWQKAIAQAGADADKLRLLATLAQDWRWARERSQLLSVLATHPDARRSELHAWREAAAQQRDTSGLASACRLLLAAGERRTDVRADFVRAHLLLGLEPERARQTAAELYAQEPGQPAVVAAYAASLRRQRQPAEALAALDRAAAQGLRSTSLAFERALSLQALNRLEEAASAAVAARDEELMPEEIALLKALRAR